MGCTIQVFRAWLGLGVAAHLPLPETTGAIHVGRRRRKQEKEGAVTRRQMLYKLAEDYGFVVDTYSPGDGWTKYSVVQVDPVTGAQKKVLVKGKLRECLFWMYGYVQGRSEK